MGLETRKLFSSFVESSVARNVDYERPPASFPAPPPAAPAAPPQWRVTDDMMNQKWGTVLRTLQPSAARTNSMVPPLVTTRPMPSYLTGKSFDPAG